MNYASIIAWISSKLPTVNPATLNKIADKLGLSYAADKVTAIRNYITENPVSAATVATLLYSSSSDMFNGIFQSDPDAAEEFAKLLPDIAKLAPNAHEVMGDRQSGVDGYSEEDIFKTVELNKKAIDLTEYIAGELGISTRKVGALVAAIQSYEPIYQKIYTTLKG